MQPIGMCAGTHQVARRFFGKWPRRRVVEGVVPETCGREHSSYDGNMRGLSRVTGTGQRDLLVVDGSPAGTQHPQCLQRFHRTAGEEWRRDVTDCQATSAVSTDGDDSTVMNAFDEAVAYDLGDEGQLEASVGSRSETSASPSR